MHSASFASVIIRRSVKSRAIFFKTSQAGMLLQQAAEGELLDRNGLERSLRLNCCKGGTMLKQGHFPEHGTFAHGCDELTLFADVRFSGDHEKDCVDRYPFFQNIVAH